MTCLMRSQVCFFIVLSLTAVVRPCQAQSAVIAEVQQLVASDAGDEDNFGTSVAISGQTAVVGAYQHDHDGFDSGSVYVFERHLGGSNAWGQRKELTASDAAAEDVFGFSAAISGNTLLVGAGRTMRVRCLVPSTCLREVAEGRTIGARRRDSSPVTQLPVTYLGSRWRFPETRSLWVLRRWRALVPVQPTCWSAIWVA